MREDKLGDLSMELSVEVLQLTKELRAKHENVISNQIGRSATSICANIAESKYARGRAAFIAKLEVSLKEINETSQWREMLWKSDYIDAEKIFFALTAKQRQDCLPIITKKIPQRIDHRIPIGF